MLGIGWTVPKPQKILRDCSIGNQSSDIGKGKTGSAFQEVSPLGVGLDVIGVKPDQRHGHHTEIEVVAHRIGVTDLAPGAADLLFDFLEAGFDHPRIRG